jgi:hypothetical protein
MAQNHTRTIRLHPTSAHLISGLCQTLCVTQDAHPAASRTPRTLRGGTGDAREGRQGMAAELLEPNTPLASLRQARLVLAECVAG